MEGIREYLIQVTAAALICGIINTIVGKKGSVAATVRVMTVILMTVTMASPLVKLRISGDSVKRLNDCLIVMQKRGDHREENL